MHIWLINYMMGLGPFIGWMAIQKKTWSQKLTLTLTTHSLTVATHASICLAQQITNDADWWQHWHSDRQITRCSAIAETALQGALYFSSKVEHWNWETIFYGHYSSIFDHCDIIGLKICRIPWKKSKIRAITAFKVIQGHRGWYQ